MDTFAQQLPRLQYFMPPKPAVVEEPKEEPPPKEPTPILEDFPLPDEPPVSTDTCRVAIRLPSGERVQRRFLKSDSVKVKGEGCGHCWRERDFLSTCVNVVWEEAIFLTVFHSMTYGMYAVLFCLLTCVSRYP